MKPTQPKFLRATFTFRVRVLTLAVAARWADAASAAPAQLNGVFIFTDHRGCDDRSHHGHPWRETPHPGQFAREGTDLQPFNARHPVCSPDTRR